MIWQQSFQIHIDHQVYNSQLAHTQETTLKLTNCNAASFTKKLTLQRIYSSWDFEGLDTLHTGSSEFESQEAWKPVNNTLSTSSAWGRRLCRGLRRTDAGKHSLGAAPRAVNAWLRGWRGRGRRGCGRRRRRPARRVRRGRRSRKGMAGEGVDGWGRGRSRRRRRPARARPAMASRRWDGRVIWMKSFTERRRQISPSLCDLMSGPTSTVSTRASQIGKTAHQYRPEG